MSGRVLEHGVPGERGLLRLTNTTAKNNGTGLATLAGGQIVSFGNNSVAGNTADGTPTSSITQR